MLDWNHQYPRNQWPHHWATQASSQLETLGGGVGIYLYSVLHTLPPSYLILLTLITPGTLPPLPQQYGQRLLSKPLTPRHSLFSLVCVRVIAEAEA